MLVVVLGVGGGFASGWWCWQWWLVVDGSMGWWMVVLGWWMVVWCAQEGWWGIGCSLGWFMVVGNKEWWYGGVGMVYCNIEIWVNIVLLEFVQSCSARSKLAKIAGRLNR